MLIFTHRLENCIKKNLLPMLLLDPNNYTIEGSFKKKIPYVTNINVTNYVYPKINEKNIYEKIIELMKQISTKNNIIFIYITCGFDDRFKIHSGSDSELNHIKELLYPKDIEQFETIIQKYSNDQNKKNFFINEMIKKYYELRWTPNDIKNNSITLNGGTIISLSDVILNNSVMFIKYCVKIGSYPIDVDITVNYKPMHMNHVCRVIDDYQAKLINYMQQHYCVLFLIDDYFKDNNETSLELKNLIKKKFGLYEQLMARINTYHLLYNTNNLDIQTATSIIVSLIKDISCIVDFNSGTIDKIKKIAENNLPDVKMREWGIMLNILYDDIDIYVNTVAKKYSIKYLNMLPKNIKDKILF